MFFIIFSFKLSRKDRLNLKSDLITLLINLQIIDVKSYSKHKHQTLAKCDIYPIKILNMKHQSTQIGVIGNITGRVQGVGFRYYTQQQAKLLGLFGTVRNLPDGSVSIEAYGPSEQIATLISWCQNGPKTSKVEEFKYQFTNYKELQTFEIVR